MAGIIKHSNHLGIYYIPANEIVLFRKSLVDVNHETDSTIIVYLRNTNHSVNIRGVDIDVFENAYLKAITSKIGKIVSV